MMFRFKSVLPFLALFLVIGLIVAAVAYRMVVGPPQWGAPQGGGGAEQAMPVQAMTAQSEPYQIWKDFSGRMMAVDYVEVRPQVGGEILRVHFNDGQMVRKGDVLFTIDPAPYRAAVNQARAEISAATTQTDLAQKDLGRAEKLLESEFVSRRAYDERKNAVQVNKAGIDLARARLDAAQINLQRTSVRAPISGRVSRAEITEGNVVGAGQGAPMLTSIVSDEGIYADFDVDEQTYVHTLRGFSGDTKIPARVMLGDGETSFDGYVHSFDNRIDPRSATIRARAYFANGSGTLLPGMFATVRIGSPQMENVILVPEKAIGTDQDRKFVYVVDSESKAAYRAVKIGESMNGKRVILSGLNNGDQVIAEGVIKLRPGALVDPQSNTANNNAKSFGKAPDAPKQSILFQSSDEPSDVSSNSASQ